MVDYKKILSYTFLLLLLMTTPSHQATQLYKAVPSPPLLVQKGSKVADIAQAHPTVAPQGRERDHYSQHHANKGNNVGNGIKGLKQVSNVNLKQQQIFLQIKKLRQDFGLKVSDKDTADDHLIKAFVQEIKVHFQPLLAIRRLYAKYQGGRATDSEGWKDCYELWGQKTKNDEGLFWEDIYHQIEKKLPYCIQISGTWTVFFKTLQDIETLLSSPNSLLYGVKEYLETIRPKEDSYLLEIGKLKAKLKPLYAWHGGLESWRWLCYNDDVLMLPTVTPIAHDPSYLLTIVDFFSLLLGYLEK